MAYGKSFGISPDDVTKDQRQVGKVQELALGYEGGVGAFVTFAAAYGIDLDQLAAQAAGAIPGNIWGQAHIMLDWHRKKGRDPVEGLGLSERAWLTCESFKLAWRDAHQAIASYWKELDTVVREAIDNPGNTLHCRLLKVRRDGAWLRIVLPSGRAVCYPSPAITDGKITYMGVNQYSRKWCRLQTYGGKIFENVCQAAARDVMSHNMPKIEAAGYQIVLTVHDEVICEAPDSDEFNEDHLSSLLAANPPWATGMPLAAAGFQTDRYKKD
jgi:DNA polymerase